MAVMVVMLVLGDGHVDTAVGFGDVGLPHTRVGRCPSAITFDEEARHANRRGRRNGQYRRPHRWTERAGVATVAPLLVQPIAPTDVADILAEIVTGEPQSRYVDVAGPETQDLVDMARRTNEVRGRPVKLVPTWSGIFGESMAGNVLLPGENARIASTTFDDWLAAGAQ